MRFKHGEIMDHCNLWLALKQMKKNEEKQVQKQLDKIRKKTKTKGKF